MRVRGLLSYDRALAVSVAHDTLDDLKHLHRVFVKRTVQQKERLLKRRLEREKSPILMWIMNVKCDQIGRAHV